MLKNYSNNRSAAKSVDNVPTIASPATGSTVELAPPPAEKASIRIQRARTVLGEILLDDELEQENGTPLMGSVAARLNELMLELDQLSGMQHLFELFVRHAQ